LWKRRQRASDLAVKRLPQKLLQQRHPKGISFFLSFFPSLERSRYYLSAGESSQLGHGSVFSFGLPLGAAQQKTP
jgi:hypothetical protein